MLMIAELLAPIFLIASANKVKGKAVAKIDINPIHKKASGLIANSLLLLVKAKSTVMKIKANSITTAIRH